MEEALRELDAHELRLVAATAACDPRSVEKHLRGEPLRSSVAHRIRSAIKTLTRRGDLHRFEADREATPR